MKIKWFWSSDVRCVTSRPNYNALWPYECLRFVFLCANGEYFCLCTKANDVGVKRRTDKPIGSMHRTNRSGKQFKFSVLSRNTYFVVRLNYPKFFNSRKFTWIIQTNFNYTVSIRKVFIWFENHYDNNNSKSNGLILIERINIYHLKSGKDIFFDIFSFISETSIIQSEYNTKW